ncbi:MAG: S9 family peptidase [Anaerolineae bacterium]|nr:S9 family peptidase [Gloeobacterales cyanobacterium ES-bin-313]
MHRGLRVGFVALLLLLPQFPLQAQPKRLISEQDLLAFTWVSDPQLSPDGSQVAYTKVVVDPKNKKKYLTSLWMVPTSGGEARPLTQGTRDSRPLWSPDGRQIAFVRSVEKNNKPGKPQIYVLPLNGGEPQALTDLSEGASSPRWSPDSKKLVFISSTLPEEMEKKEKKDEEEKSDVQVITDSIYRQNGSGYLDQKHHDHLWSVSVGQTPKQLTSGIYDEGEPVWSADSSQIFFVSDRRPQPSYLSGDDDIYAVPSTGGSIKPIASINGGIADLSLSPDGRRIAFVGFPNTESTRSYNQPDLFVTELTPGSIPRNLTTKYDYDIGGGIISDQHPPRGGGGSTVSLWSADSRFLIVNTAERGKANLRRFDAETGAVTAFTEGQQEIIAYTGTPGTTKIAALISKPTLLGDLFLISGQSEPIRLTRANDALFEKLQLSEPEVIEYPSFDGKLIQAWVQKPPNFDPKQKYPLILNIHGGPHAAYGYNFFHEMQWMAARGYVVLYPNPRGSTSYGQDFANIIQYKFPGDDYKDLMAGVDYVINQGYVDAEKLGVTGGSGGGLLTNWTVTQTERFKAAVSQRSIADWEGFWYSADFNLFTPFWFRGAPWKEEADFKARSPITFIERVKTPLMLVEGDEDLRTPAATGGEQMFRALKYLKRPTVMVRFPGETHDLSRSGQPQHRIERLQHILGWFDKYLLGKPIKDYDIENTK